jgi:2-oxoglutarate dehydrogenase E1 component
MRSLLYLSLGVKMDLLKQVGVAITELPSSFTPHKQIRKVYDNRRAMIDTGAAMRWL